MRYICKVLIIILAQERAQLKKSQERKRERRRKKQGGREEGRKGRREGGREGKNAAQNPLSTWPFLSNSTIRFSGVIISMPCHLKA